MATENSKVIDLNVKKEDRILDFSDFQKQEVKFDIEKLQEAYHQIVKIKKFEDAGVTHFGAISLTQIPGDPDSIKGICNLGSGSLCQLKVDLGSFKRILTLPSLYLDERVSYTSLK